MNKANHKMYKSQISKSKFDGGHMQIPEEFDKQENERGEIQMPLLR